MNEFFKRTELQDNVVLAGTGGGQSLLKRSPLFIRLNPLTLAIPSEDPAIHLLAIHHYKMVGGELMATDERGYQISHHLHVKKTMHI